MALVRDEKSIEIAIGHCALGSFHQEDAIIVTFPQNARSFAKLRAFVTLSFRSRCLGYRRAGKQM